MAATSLLPRSSFYLGLGFFVVFFTTKYAAVSLYARWSYFWPCMGRVVNNVCSMFVTAPAVAIISSQNVLAAVGAALVMFVGIAITLLGQLGQRADDAAMRDGLPLATDDLGGDLAPTCSDPEPVEAAELTSDERLDAFVATFGLTERERDILEVLVVSDQSVQDIGHNALSFALHALSPHFLDQQKGRYRLACGPYQLLLVLDTQGLANLPISCGGIVPKLKSRGFNLGTISPATCWGDRLPAAAEAAAAALAAVVVATAAGRVFSVYLLQQLAVAGNVAGTLPAG